MTKLFPLLLSIFTIMSPVQATENFPTKPINIIVPVAPGGTTDLAARTLADPLSKTLGQTIIVENKVGASGSIAIQHLLRAQPDGHTLLMQYSGYHLISPHFLNVKWDPIKDFTPIAQIVAAPQVLVVKKDLPVESLKELIDYAKAHPGKLNYGTSGNGSIHHLSGEMLNYLADIQTTPIPYGGAGPALTDLLAGHIDFLLTTPPPLISHIENGAIKALAVTSTRRLESLPNVPTSIEAGLPDLQISAWFALYANKNIPSNVVNKLNYEIEKVMKDKNFQNKLKALGANPQFVGTKEFSKLAETEYYAWKDLIQKANIR